MIRIYLFCVEIQVYKFVRVVVSDDTLLLRSLKFVFIICTHDMLYFGRLKTATFANLQYFHRHRGGRYGEGLLKLLNTKQNSLSPKR